MSDYQLRPNVNRDARARDYNTESGSTGIRVLVIGAIIVVVFAAMYFSSGGDDTLVAPDASPVIAPDALGVAPAPGAPQPVVPGE